MRRPGIKPGSRPWQGRILSLYYRRALTNEMQIIQTRSFEPSAKPKVCAGRESNPGLVRGRDVYYHCTTGAKVFAPRLELGISRVLGERHNQLDHANIGNGVSGFRSQYLVLAKDARFRLRQYPMLSR